MVCGKEVSAGEVIATSANQIALPKFHLRYKNVILYLPDPSLGSRLW